MILLDQIIEIFTLTQFASVWHQPLRFQLFECFWIGRVFINRDDARCAGMRRGKRFREEAFGRLRVSGRTEQKFQGISLRIHSTIEVHPHFFHFDVRLIDAPRVVRGLEMGTATLLQFGCVALYPTVDRVLIDMQSPLAHHLLQISVAERIPEVPADTEQNNLSLEVTPFEWSGGIHEIGSSQFSEYCRVYRILAIFATQPLPVPGELSLVSARAGQRAARHWWI